MSRMGWGERGDAFYFNNPVDYVANLNGDHLDWLRSRVHLTLVAGQGPWEDDSASGALPSTLKLASLLGGKRIPLRARHLGLRLRPRLAMVAAPAGRAPAAALLSGRRSARRGQENPRPSTVSAAIESTTAWYELVASKTASCRSALVPSRAIVWA